MARKNETIPAPELPKRIMLDTDFIYVMPQGNSEYTRQFYAGQVITDMQAIAELIALGAPIREQS